MAEWVSTSTSPRSDAGTPVWRARWARPAYLVTGVITALGVVLTTVLSTLDAYDPEPVEPGLFGGHRSGWAGAWPRLIDDLSYFTIWSNIVVAITMVMLARRPRQHSRVIPVLVVDSLMMITVTGVVYAALLAPVMNPTGWAVVTNPWLHYLTPPLTVLVWVVFGPRGMITVRSVLAALVLPLTWIAWTFVRAEFTGQYPYGFLNVTELGVPTVVTVLMVIIAFALFVAAVYGLIDRLLARRVP